MQLYINVLAEAWGKEKAPYSFSVKKTVDFVISFSILWWAGTSE